MAFMKPQYDDGAFERYENDKCETFIVPAGTCSASDIDDMDISLTEHTIGKWYYRLSASGYMDRTEWTGPFDTEEEARADLSDVYNCDPDTGDLLEDEETVQSLSHSGAALAPLGQTLHQTKPPLTGRLFSCRLPRDQKPRNPTRLEQARTRAPRSPRAGSSASLVRPGSGSIRPRLPPSPRSKASQSDRRQIHRNAPPQRLTDSPVQIPPPEAESALVALRR